MRAPRLQRKRRFFNDDFDEIFNGLALNNLQRILGVFSARMGKRDAYLPRRRCQETSSRRAVIAAPQGQGPLAVAERRMRARVGAVLVDLAEGGRYEMTRSLVLR